MNTCIWLDDFRSPNQKLYKIYKQVVTIKNYDDFISFINTKGLPECICFDHDLGEGKTGYDCAKFLVDYCIKHNCDLPDYYSQSDNIVGKTNILQLLDRYKKFYNEGI